MIKPKILKEAPEVESRLKELSLTLDGLLFVRSVALAAAADATPNHPSNAGGSFAYHHGVAAIRSQFLGESWKRDRSHGVECISNEELKIKIAYSNVYRACNVAGPKAKSTKGHGVEKVCGDGITDDMFPDAEIPVPTTAADGWATYFLMVDQLGAAELSRPTIYASNFGPCIERIYLSDGSDIDFEPQPFEDSDDIDDFDPIVKRR